MSEKIFGRLFYLDIARERSHDRLLDAFRPHFVDHFDHDFRKHHRRCNDRVPVAENQRVDARIFEAEPDRVLVSLRRLAAGDIDGVARRTERGDELAESGVEIGRASCRERVLLGV